MSAAFNFRQLIDLAIGSPEPGHVNFYALHCLLCSFAQKLNVIEEEVDCSKCGFETLMLHVAANAGSKVAKKRLWPSVRNRLTGGAVSPDEGEVADAAAPTAEEAVTTDDSPAENEAATEITEPDTEHDAEVPAAAPEMEETTTVSPAADEVDLAVLTAASPEQKSQLKLHEPSVGMEKSSSSIVRLQPPAMPVELQRGMAIMKDQLELTMEQLHKLTGLLIRNRTDASRVGQVRALAKQLRSIQRDNVFIEGTNRFKMADELSMSALESEDMEEEEDDYIVGEGDAEAADELRSQKSKMMESISIMEKAAETLANDDYDLDMHLCYSPEKMLDLLLELKSEFCMLTNKVNELSAIVLAQDSNRTVMLIQELQDQVRELKLNYTTTRSQLDNFDIRLGLNAESIEKVQHAVQDLIEEKVDRSEMTVLLADKVDYSQLQRKVSKEQMQELQCRLEKGLCELHKLMGMNESNIMRIIDEMRQSLGIHVVEEMLNKFQEKVNKDICAVSHLLKKYMDATNDDCAAAGTRIKVLQDLACLSCDTTCVMRTREKSKVAKLPSAKATNLISPLITYELGSIRKSGIMGYYRKDEFPHAPNAWLHQNQVACQQTRYAGGAHTTYTAKERVERISQQPK